jgi:hypothetical protein
MSTSTTSWPTPTACPEEHIGRTPRDILPEVGPGLEDIMRKVMASGVAECNFEASAEIPPARAASPTGMPATTRALTSRAACGIIAMVEDVSLKKQAELAIRASNERIRKVLDALFTFVGVLSIDGTLLEANRARWNRPGWNCPTYRASCSGSVTGGTTTRHSAGAATGHCPCCQRRDRALRRGGAHEERQPHDHRLHAAALAG